MKKIFVFFLLLLVSYFSNAQTARVSTTTGAVAINGKEIKYKATVEEVFLPAKGDAAGSVITTTYEAEVTNSLSRPVIFLFNGGPGASSSPLHMYAFGPVRLKKEPDSTRQVNNDYSLLDVADLVFIDPMGTGFTRIFKQDSAAGYWDVEGDARSVISVVKSWKEQHNRNDSPIFICGESYGTVRAAKMIAIAENFPLKGLLLFSPVLDFSLMAPVSGNEMPYLLRLPSMAAVAWYHHKSAPEFKTAQEAFDAAIDFAKRDYLHALFQGNELSERQRIEVAEKLAALIGLPVKTILDHNLRINSDDFEMLLLADKNRRIGKLDGQISAPLPKESKPYSSRDDPSLVVNTVMSGDVVGRYFKNHLQFSDARIYRGVNFTVNGKWKWNSMDAYLGYYSVLPGLENAFKQNSQLKLLVAGGIYDLATPLYSGKYLLDHSSISPERTTFLSFPTGHSIFDSEKELAKLSAQVKDFISE